MKKGIILLGRGMRYIEAHGAAQLYRKIRERRLQNHLERPYSSWLLDSQPDAKALKEQRRWSEGKNKKISILVPAYETPPEFLRQMVASVLAQTYRNWELCIADGSESSQVEETLKPYREKDSRIRYQRLKENLGISQNTNAALAMATGEYVGLLDHDDILFPHTLYEVARAMEEHPKGQAFYTDEDKVSFDLQEHFQPHFKPDFNLELLRSNNYICHFFVADRELALRTGGFLEEFDGAQDYDFIFRCVEQAEEVVHIPQILYSWRSHASSTAENPESKLYAYDAGKRAVQAHLRRQGVRAQVQDTSNYGFYRVRYSLSQDRNIDWKNAGFTGLRNSFEKWNRQTGIKVVYYNNTCNKVVTFRQKMTTEDREEGALSGYVLFTCVKKGKLGENFLQEMISVCQRPEVGIVCARVYGRDGRLSHSVEMAGVKDPFHRTMKGLRKGYLGYFHRACLQQEVNKVTDCFLMRMELFAELAAQPSNEAGQIFLPIDRLAGQVRQKGYRVVYNPWAVLYERK